MLEASFVFSEQGRVCPSNRGTLGAGPATGHLSEYTHL